MTPSSARTSTACSRETSSLASTRSQASPRPIRYGRSGTRRRSAGGGRSRAIRARGSVSHIAVSARAGNSVTAARAMVAVPSPARPGAADPVEQPPTGSRADHRPRRPAARAPRPQRPPSSRTVALPRSSTHHSAPRAAPAAHGWAPARQTAARPRAGAPPSRISPRFSSTAMARSEAARLGARRSREQAQLDGHGQGHSSSVRRVRRVRRVRLVRRVRRFGKPRARPRRSCPRADPHRHRAVAVGAHHARPLAV